MFERRNAKTKRYQIQNREYLCSQSRLLRPSSELPHGMLEDQLPPVFPMVVGD